MLEKENIIDSELVQDVVVDQISVVLSGPEESLTFQTRSKHSLPPGKTTLSAFCPVRVSETLARHH